MQLAGGNDTGAGAGSASGFNDEIHGHDGNDVIAGEAGVDIVWSEAGDDTVSGNTSFDDLHLGAGWDKATGGMGDDEIFGGASRDNMKGGEDQDRIEDNCCGNINEKDYVCGETGFDTIFVNDTDEEDIVWDPSGSDNVSKDPGDGRTNQLCQI